MFLAWQQHDIQELCRVMFDALEQKWKLTVQVGESKKFSSHSESTSHKGNKRPTVGKVKWANKPQG